MGGSGGGKSSPDFTFFCVNTIGVECKVYIFFRNIFLNELLTLSLILDSIFKVGKLKELNLKAISMIRYVLISLRNK